MSESLSMQIDVPGSDISGRYCVAPNDAPMICFTGWRKYYGRMSLSVSALPVHVGAMDLEPHFDVLVCVPTC